MRPSQSCSCRVDSRWTVDRGIWASVFCYRCPVLFTFSSACLSLSRVSGKVGRMVPEQQMFRLQRCLPANNWSQCSRETFGTQQGKQATLHNLRTLEPSWLCFPLSPQLLLSIHFLCALPLYGFFCKCFCQPLLCYLKMRGIFSCGGLLLVTLLLTSADAKGTLYGSPYRYNLHKSGSVPQYNPGKPTGHHK